MTPEGRALMQRIGTLFTEDRRMYDVRSGINQAAAEVRQAIEDYETAVGASTGAMKGHYEDREKLIRNAAESTLADYLARLTASEAEVARLRSLVP